jgi:hypothetical protein
MQGLDELKVSTLTLGGLPANHRQGAEVSRGHSNLATSCTAIIRPNAEDSQNNEGPNVRMAKRSSSL